MNIASEQPIILAILERDRKFIIKFCIHVLAVVHVQITSYSIISVFVICVLAKITSCSFREY